MVTIAGQEEDALGGASDGVVSDDMSKPSSDSHVLKRSLTPQDGRFVTFHDGVVHNPLGSGSYIFKDSFVPALFRYLGIEEGVRQRTVILHIGAQPNNSPHVGTLSVFALAFLLGREMKRHHQRTQQPGERPDKLDIQINLDIVDTAPDSLKTLTKDGVTYQLSHRYTKAMAGFMPDYEEALRSLHDFVHHEVSYKVTTQETLMKLPSIPSIISALVKDRERLGAELAPDRQVLALRRACPQAECGYADKHGRKNTYVTTPSGETIITFVCPLHGDHSISLSNPTEVAELEFNTPLRNLVRAMAYGQDTLESQDGNQPERVHMRVTGMDYAGTYQEQLLWRQLYLLRTCPSIPPPLIVYAPLILDWAGSKLSKSLYVTAGAYTYLEERKMEYLLSFKAMKECGRDVKILFREMEKWLKEPKLLFRSYTIEYMHSVFEREAREAREATR